jgi:hypothetical protein
MVTALVVGWSSAAVAFWLGDAQSAGAGGDWGTYPAWVSAIGASLAFFLTFRLFLQGRRDRIREQATLVYATESRNSIDGGPVSVTATVVNKSNGPLWEVEVHPRWDDEQVAVAVEQPRPFVDPEQSLTVEEWESVIGREVLPHLLRPPRVVFSDSSGRRWEKVGSRTVALNGWRRIWRKALRRWAAFRER